MSTAQRSNNSIIEELQRDLESKNFTLPPLPDSAIRVRRAIDDPNADCSKVSKVIGIDPVLTGRIIQAANSPLFKGLHKIEDLNTAISRLGLTCVQNLVVSLTVGALFKSANKPWIRRKLLDIWRSSIKIAALSEVLSRGRKGLDPAEAMLAGLLHDVGVIPMIILCDKKYGEPTDSTMLDEAAFLISPNLTSWILKQWNLSSSITEVPNLIQDLHREHENSADYSDIIQVARLHTWRGKSHPLGNIPWHTIPAFEKLDLTPEESIAAIKESHNDIKEVMAILKG